MGDVENLTVSILREIRDEIRQTNVRLDRAETSLTGRIDATNERIESMHTALSTRLDQVEGTLVELATQQRFVVRHLKKLVKHDARLERLEGRVDRLEGRTPPQP